MVIGLILLDEYWGRGLAPLKGEIPDLFQQQIVPTAIMVALSALLVLLVWRIYRPTTRELIMALFTGFVVSYFILTISGTAFRGTGMDLSWPWNIEVHE